MSVDIASQLCLWDRSQKPLLASDLQDAAQQVDWGARFRSGGATTVGVKNQTSSILRSEGTEACLLSCPGIDPKGGVGARPAPATIIFHGVAKISGTVLDAETAPPSTHCFSYVFVSSHSNQKKTHSGFRVHDPFQAARLIGKRIGGAFLSSPSVITGNKAEISSSERWVPWKYSSSGNSA